MDDDSYLLQLNTAVLLRSGYEVDAAEDGAAAWEALQVARYDLLITDNNMPKLTGVELVKRLRDQAVPLPVIMATGIMPVQEMDRNSWLAPLVVLLKPYTIEQLLDTVKAVLQAAKGAPQPDGKAAPG